MLGVVQKADGPPALGDAHELVIEGVGDVAPQPGDLVAIGVIGECGAERPKYSEAIRR